MLVPLVFYDRDETKMNLCGIGRGVTREGETQFLKGDSILQAHV